MPVTVIVGGQFGSEGKGKVAHYFAKEQHARIAVRVGGSNSGHTIVEPSGRRLVFRQLPTASILPGVTSVIASGSYIEPDVLMSEIERFCVDPSTVKIDPLAVVIKPEHKTRELRTGLSTHIGSTLSGTGAALVERIERDGETLFAKDDPRLSEFLTDTKELMCSRITAGDRAIIEGTQGFGLSVLHSDYHPYVTSRDTTAAGFLSEAGLSPLWVDEIVMVIRAFPIRVAGNSGPLPNETTWEQVTIGSGYPELLCERTSVTGNVRRVATFDPEVVRHAIQVNQPTSIALNHLDYVDFEACRAQHETKAVSAFVENVNTSIGRPVSHIGWASDHLSSHSFNIASNTAA